MYWNPELFLMLSVLFQEPTSPQISITFDYVQLVIGLILGLSPTIFTAIKEKVKWKDESKIVQSQAVNVQTEAVENIATAAGILLDQSHRLNEKNTVLIATYETAMERQAKMIEEERALRIAQEKDFIHQIEVLKQQITDINTMVIWCSTEIIAIVKDIKNGVEISPERIEELENKWKEL